MASQFEEFKKFLLVSNIFWDAKKWCTKTSSEKNIPYLHQNLKKNSHWRSPPTCSLRACCQNTSATICEHNRISNMVISARLMDLFIDFTRLLILKKMILSPLTRDLLACWLFLIPYAFLLPIFLTFEVCQGAVLTFPHHGSSEKKTLGKENGTKRHFTCLDVTLFWFGAAPSERMKSKE